MNFLRTVWPFSFKEKTAVSQLVITVVIYAIAPTVLYLLGLIPYAGIVFNILGYVCSLYSTAGIAFTFLNYFKVGPFANDRA